PGQPASRRDHPLARVGPTRPMQFQAIRAGAPTRVLAAPTFSPASNLSEVMQTDSSSRRLRGRRLPRCSAFRLTLHNQRAVDGMLALADRLRQERGAVLVGSDHVSAVVRVDDTLDSPDKPWPVKVSISHVLSDGDAAEREVERLNAVNRYKGCVYFLQMTRVSRR